VIPPYDDYVVMAGQGTIAIEIVRQLSELATPLDFLVCPVGGGGLVAGIGTALAELSPSTSVCSAEPEDFDDTRRSIIAGKRLENPLGASSICDSILTPMPGAKTFPINQKRLSFGLAVSESEVVSAIELLAEELKIVAEPGGAVAVAAALAQRGSWDGKTVVAVVSGGNVDLSVWRNLLAARRIGENE
jgi:threonine dehydratase